MGHGAGTQLFAEVVWMMRHSFIVISVICMKKEEEIDIIMPMKKVYVKNVHSMMDLNPAQNATEQSASIVEPRNVIQRLFTNAYHAQRKLILHFSID